MIIDANLIDERVSYTFSSERSGYPASNALDINKRKRTWRSAGYWLIESGSNTLVINDAAGVNITATVAAGEYTTDSLFFAALKTALEAASQSTFTISRDTTTNKIKILAALGGTASVFRIICTNAASADMCGILGYSVLSDRTGALFYIADLLKIHTSEWFIFDFGFPVSPTAFLAFADRSYPMRISSTAVVNIQGNLTNDFTAPLVDEVATVSDYGIGLADADGIGAGVACRYWKVEIIDQDNAYGYVEIGAMIIGTHVLTNRSPVFPFNSEDNDLSQREYSEGGQVISSKRAQTEIIPLSWDLLDVTSFENLVACFETYGTHSAFAVILDVDGVFSSTFLKWAKLVRMNNEPRKNLVSFQNWSVQWNLREDL